MTNEGTAFQGTSFWGGSLVLFAALASACGPATVDDLPPPTLAVTVREGGGFCSAVFAVDGTGGIWYAQGCGDDDSGLEQRTTTVSDAERGELDAMMDEVLALSDDPECDFVSPSDRSYRFVRTGAAAGEVRQCGSGIPLVALELAGRLEGLAAPAVDGGSADAR